MALGRRRVEHHDHAVVRSVGGAGWCRCVVVVCSGGVVVEVVVVVVVYNCVVRRVVG